MNLLLAKLSTVDLILIVALGVVLLVLATTIVIRAKQVRKSRRAGRPGHVLTSHEDMDVAEVLAGMEEYHRLAHHLILREGDQAYMVDHLYVSSVGVFVLAEKSFDGKVIGQEISPTWSERLGEATRKFANPLLEMQPVVRLIADLIGERAPVYWMLVIEGDILGIDAEHVCGVEHLKTYLNQPTDEPLSHDAVDELYERIRLAE